MYSDCTFSELSYQVFRDFSSGIVPVVLGAAAEDYHSVAPHGSYIHVDNFISPAQLAHYLHSLANNDTLYNEFFTWKGKCETIVLLRSI